MKNILKTTHTTKTNGSEKKKYDINEKHTKETHSVKCIRDVMTKSDVPNSQNLGEYLEVRLAEVCVCVCVSVEDSRGGGGSSLLQR